jgi:outer membrane autotransporter protein
MSQNKFKKLACSLAVGGLLAALSEGAFAQDNSVNISAGGVAGGDLSATVLMLEYERLMGQHVSVFGRVSSLDYKFDDGTYVEDGKGTGIGVGLRYWPTSPMKGLYIGGAVGYFKSDWDFIDDKGRTFESRGTGESKAIQWGAELGYRFKLSKNVSLTPALNVGSWVGTDDSCRYTAPASRVGTACSKESQLGFYAVGSVSLGIAF